MQSYSGVPKHDYGSLPGLSGGPTHNFIAAVVLLILLVAIPWGFFTSLSWILISIQIYENPNLKMMVLLSSSSIVVFVILAAVLARGRWLRKGGRLGGGERLLKGVVWWSSLALLTAIALIAAAVVASMNYSTYWQRFYELTTLAKHMGVDPSITHGQQLLDAGSVTFSLGVKPILNMSASFADGKLYCVAPIVSSGALPAVYDFWAVGVNCCSPNFSCGPVDMMGARGGLRVVDTDLLVKYRRAVAIAQAQYQIQTQTPLYFTWVADPTASLNDMKDAGMDMFWLSSIITLAILGPLVLVGYVMFARWH
jgi:hypothetical protein